MLVVPVGNQLILLGMLRVWFLLFKENVEAWEDVSVGGWGGPLIVKDTH